MDQLPADIWRALVLASRGIAVVRLCASFRAFRAVCADRALWVRKLGADYGVGDLDARLDPFRLYRLEATFEEHYSALDTIVTPPTRVSHKPVAAIVDGVSVTIPDAGVGLDDDLGDYPALPEFGLLDSAGDNYVVLFPRRVRSMWEVASVSRHVWEGRDVVSRLGARTTGAHIVKLENMTTNLPRGEAIASIVFGINSQLEGEVALMDNADRPAFRRFIGALLGKLESPNASVIFGVFLVINDVPYEFR